MTEIVHLADYPWVYLVCLKNCGRMFSNDNSVLVYLDLPQGFCKGHEIFATVTGCGLQMLSYSKQNIQDVNNKFAINPIDNLDKRIAYEETYFDYLAGKYIEKENSDASKDDDLDSITNTAKKLIILDRAKAIWLAMRVLPLPIIDELLLVGILVDGRQIRYR